MSRIVVSVVALVVVTGPLTAQAKSNPIIERAQELGASNALERLSGVRQAGCDPALVTRALDDASRAGTGGWRPAAAGDHASDRRWRFESAVLGDQRDDFRRRPLLHRRLERRCQPAEGVERLEGHVIGIGTYVGLSVLVMATGPDY